MEAGIVGETSYLDSAPSHLSVIPSGEASTSLPPTQDRRAGGGEKSIPRNDPAEQWGPWRCVCGAVSSTSAVFLLHSRACSVRGGGAAEVEEGRTGMLPTVREQMISMLRATVGSCGLRGDCLSAAVHALQSGNEQDRVQGESENGIKRGEKEERLCRIKGKRLGAPWQLRAAFLPVSGTALLAAEEANNKPRCSSPGNSVPPLSQFYTVLPHGLRYAKKLTITHTYRYRAAFSERDGDGEEITSSSSKHSSLTDGGHGDAFRPEGSAANDRREPPPPPLHCFPKLQFNAAHEEMSSYVYKRFLPRDDAIRERDSELKDTESGDARGEKRCRDDSQCVDTVLRREGRRIARVPMPVLEWHYPK